MSNKSTETCHKKLPAQPEVTNPESTEAERLRRSERTRTLTEKGKELQEERIKSVQRRYRIIYEKWKCHARISKEILSDEASQEELNDLIENIKNTCAEVKVVYEELRRVQTPETDLRRRVDTCVSFSEFIIRRAQRHIEGHAFGEEEEPWPDVGSVLASTSSVSRSLSQQSKCSSAQSSFRSVKRNEAVAEAAASQEVLAVLEEQEREIAELQRLEVENKQCLARFESEDLARQQAMEDKRRKLERLEEIKKLNAARARVKVYDQVETNLEPVDSLHNVDTVGELQVPNVANHYVHPQSLPITTQTLNASSPPFIPQSQPVQTLQWSSQAQPDLAPMPQSHNFDLVNALAEAMSANRLPTPEPALFNGDPLKFKDWQLSFETLIDRKNIPKNEKLYYLRKYLGGAAKKTVEGFFLLGTEAAYDSAWQLLEQQFGDPFIIGKSFRDKLHGWPKINPKDGCELREFADFLKSCEAAMPHLKGEVHRFTL